MQFYNLPEIYDNETQNSIYKKLLEQIPDLVFKLAWHKSNQEYAAIYIGKGINSVFEITLEEFQKDPNILIEKIILPEYRKAFLDSIVYATETVSPWIFEFKANLPVKGLRTLKVIAKPEEDEESICFYGRITDITSQRKQEMALEMSEERYKYALKAASEGIWDFNTVNNQVYFSAHSMRIIGFKERDIVKPLEFWNSRIHQDDFAAYNKNLQDFLKNKTASYEAIYRILTNQGTYRWVLSRGKGVNFDESGRILRSIGTHKDITLIKEKETELAKTIDIIGEQNNRLINFAHIVSHNLRSHAGNLKMLLDLFKSASENERAEMMQHLEAISDGLYVTIGHLKELVEIQFEIKNIKEELNLRHYLKNILNILHNEITKHGIRIDINIPIDATVQYNPAYLESILLNFTTNAIKYSSPERKPMISYDYEIINNKKTLSITDNGLGIDLKKHKSSLFGMYKTFHKNQNSRGIGLFITKNQIEAMGGTIEVSSEVNKGTTFKICFNEEHK